MKSQSLHQKSFKGNDLIPHILSARKGDTIAEYLFKLLELHITHVSEKFTRGSP
jgi:hypothetical protein